MQTVILLAVLAILIVVLVELVESRKRNEADAYASKQAVARLFAENIALVEEHDQAKILATIRADHDARIERILAENIALENKAQELVSNYGY